MAFNNGCEYCKAKGNPSNAIIDLQTQVAAHVANLSSKEKHISDQDFCTMREVFTESEISDSPANPMAHTAATAASKGLSLLAEGYAVIMALSIQPAPVMRPIIL